MFTQYDIAGINIASIRNYFIHNKIVYNREKDMANTRQLIISLKNHAIDKLKNDFFFNNNSINIQQFLWLMQKCVSFKDKHKYQVYYELVRLFQQIDIDDSQIIDWNQLLEYLSCNGWTNTKQTSKKHIVQENQQKNDNQFVFCYKQNAKFRKNPLQNIMEMERLSLLCLLQKKSNTVNFTTIDGMSTDFSLFSLSSQQGKIISIDFSDCQRIFGVILINKKLIFIQEGELQKNLGTINLNGSETQIKYLQKHNLWLLKSIDNTLQVFKPPKGLLKPKQSLQILLRFKPHEQPITSIVQITNQLGLCTCSLDGKIKIWSLNYKQLLIQFQPSKQQEIPKLKGVRGLTSYNFGMTSYMASWTFTCQISIWLPSASLAKPFIGLLKGHIGIIEQCAFTYQKSILVSIDNKKSVRIWNVQNLQCLQIWSVDQNVHIYPLKSQPQIILFNKLMTFYRNKTINKTSIDLINEKHSKKTVNPSICIINMDFCLYYNYLLILTNQSLKCIEINTGEIMTTINPTIPSQQFLEMCKKINRRVFIASNLGFIYLYKIQDGTLIRKYNINMILQETRLLTPKCVKDAQIKYIYFHMTSSTLMVCVQLSQQSIILTFNQDPSSINNNKIKQCVFPQINLDFFSFCSTSDVFCLGSTNGIISIWQYSKLSISCSLKINEEIVNVRMEQNHSLLIVLTNLHLYIIQLDQTLSHVKYQQVLILQQCFVSFDIMRIQKLSLPVQLPRLKRYQQFNNEKRLKFIGQLQKQKKRTVICLCSENKIQFYEIQTILEQFKIQQLVQNKHNVYLLKQSKKISMKQVQINMMSKQSANLNTYFIHEFFIKSETFTNICTVCNLFAVWNNEGYFRLIKPNGYICALWGLSFPKPKIWSVFYPIIDKMLARLKKTQRAIRKIQTVKNWQSFQKLFLINRFFTPQTFAQLKELIKNEKQRLKYMSQNSKPIATAEQEFEKFGILEDEFNQFKMYNETKKKQSNLFEQKYQRRFKKEQEIRNKKIKIIDNKFKSQSLANLRQKNQQTKKDFQIKKVQNKLGLSKSSYKLKASVTNFKQNMYEGKRDYQALIRKIKNMQANLSRKNSLIKL